MGQRSRTETVAAVLARCSRVARGRRPSSRAVGVRPEALRKVLEELQASGVPLVDGEGATRTSTGASRKTGSPVASSSNRRTSPISFASFGGSRAARCAIGSSRSSTSSSRAGASTATVPVASRSTTDQEEQYVPVVEDAAEKKGCPLDALLHGQPRNDQRAPRVRPRRRRRAARAVRRDVPSQRGSSLVSRRLHHPRASRPRRAVPRGDGEAVAAFRAASLDGFKGSAAPSRARSSCGRPSPLGRQQPPRRDARRDAPLTGSGCTWRRARSFVWRASSSASETRREPRTPRSRRRSQSSREARSSALDADTEHARSAVVSEAHARDPVRPRSDV